MVTPEAFEPTSKVRLIVAEKKMSLSAYATCCTPKMDLGTGANDWHSDTRKQATSKKPKNQRAMTANEAS